MKLPVGAYTLDKPVCALVFKENKNDAAGDAKRQKEHGQMVVLVLLVEKGMGVKAPCKEGFPEVVFVRKE
jgi:hypothetical protein